MSKNGILCPDQVWKYYLYVNSRAREGYVCRLNIFLRAFFLTGLKFQLSISSVSWQIEKNCLDQGLARSVESDFITKNIFKLKWGNRIYGSDFITKNIFKLKWGNRIYGHIPSIWEYYQIKNKAVGKFSPITYLVLCCIFTNNTLQYRILVRAKIIVQEGK